MLWLRPEGGIYKAASTIPASSSAADVMAPSRRAIAAADLARQVVPKWERGFRRVEESVRVGDWESRTVGEWEWRVCKGTVEYIANLIHTSSFADQHPLDSPLPYSYLLMYSLLPILYLQMQRAGLPLRIPSEHPMKTLMAQRLLSASDEHTRPSLTHKLFAAYWLHGQNIADPEVLGIATGLGRERVQGLAESEVARDSLTHWTEQAVAQGAFGVPRWEGEGG